MKKMLERKNNNIVFLKLFLLVTPFIIGGYHMWISALLSLVLFGYIVVIILKSKEKINIEVDVSLLSLILIPASYLVVSLWAIDSSTAVYGFIKFLPLVPFAILISQLNTKEKNELLDTVPVSAIAMGTISYGLSFISELSDYFLVASRLGGFFQYPNTFAAYCLAGLAILLFKEKLTYKEWIMSALLVGIVFLTGSRTSFVFLIIVCAILFFRISYKNKLRLVALIGGAIALSLVIVALTGNIQTVGRYLTISLESSTLLGRLLYYKDAIPVILKNPFGLGYYGYYFSQTSFQTGVYSTAFVHNEFLQLLLDIGWIPSILFFFVLGKSFLSKKINSVQKTVMFIILGHSFFDFDLQFLSIFLILILTLDFDNRKLVSFKSGKFIHIAVSSALVAVSLFFGIINGLFLLGNYETVEKIYGKDTQSQIFLMQDSTSYDDIASYSESILSRNEYIAIAYDAKANEAYKEGNIKAVIDYKDKAIAVAPYKISEYNDYCEKLINITSLYIKNGDYDSAEYCIEKLVDVQRKIDETKQKTSSLAWKIKDKPELELDEKYQDYIKEALK